MKVLVFQNLPNTGFVDDITHLVSRSLSFSTKTPGLYHQLSFDLNRNVQTDFSIFQQYLGYRIVVFDEFNDVAWDGLIWSVEIAMGDHSLGPQDMEFVQNYVVAEYSDILNDNRYAQTAYVADADSQTRYGIKEYVAGLGQFTSVAAENYRDRFIGHHKVPFSSGTINIPVGGDALSVRVTALGFWATTRYRKFQSIIPTITTVQNRIKEIVDRSVVPNTPASTYYLQFFSTDTGLIEGTNLNIARASTHVDTIGYYLERVVSLGDTSFNSWYIGAEHGEYHGEFPLGLPRVKVWQRPTAVEFICDVLTGQVMRPGGEIVSPSKIRAGNFVQIRGAVPQGAILSTPLDQLQGFVLSETTFDAGTGVLRGTPEGTDRDLSILLARLSG